MHTFKIKGFMNTIFLIEYTTSCESGLSEMKCHVQLTSMKKQISKINKTYQTHFWMKKKIKTEREGLRIRKMNKEPAKQSWIQATQGFTT
jgi:hypothetical protein